jgi:predicted nucleic acid-binding protein
VYDLFVELCPLVYSVTLADTDRASKIIAETDSGVRDTIHAAVMMNNDVRWIATWDKGFDHIKGIERIALD